MKIYWFIWFCISVMSYIYPSYKYCKSVKNEDADAAFRAEKKLILPSIVSFIFLIGGIIYGIII